MPKKPTYDELQRRVAELESQQQQRHQLLTEIARRKQSEQELFNTNERLSALMNSLPVAVSFSDDVTCQRITGNPALLAQFEITPSDNISASASDPAAAGRRIRFFQDGREIQAFELPLQRAVAENREISLIDLEVLLPSGRRFSASAFGAPIHNQRGDVVGGVAVTVDITNRKKAEEALKESQNRFRVLTQNISAGVALINEYGQFTIVNQAFLRLFDLPSDSDIKNVNDRDWSQWQVFDERGKLLDVDEHPVRKVVLTGQPVRDRLVGVRPPSGEALKWMLITAESVLKPDGCIDAVICTYHEITNRKLAEEALRESENRFRSIAENLSEGLMLFDMEGNLIYQNPASLRIHGFGDPTFGHVNREDLPSRWEGFRENGSPLQFEDWPIFRVFRRHERFQNQVLRARHVDTGKEFFASYNGSPIYDPEGKPVLGFVSIRDITESKRAEEALRESEERKRAAEVLASSEKEFRLLAEAMPQIVWTTRADGWNNYFNQQWVEYTGLTLEKSYGHGWNRPFHPEDQKGAWDAWQNAVTNRASYSLECRLRRADGVYRWWLIRGVPVLDEKGNILKWFGTCTDIEDLKRAEAALMQANADLEHRAAQLRALAGELTLSEHRERSRLAKILHDHLQQLLVAAKFRLTILSRGADDALKQATKEIEGLIDESITSSRSLTAELSPPILHEGGLIAGLEWLSRRMADTQGLLVDLELQEMGSLPDDLNLMLFESARELLFNVSKHAHTRSSAVSLKRVDEFLQLTVTDQGLGFDPNVLLRAGGQGTGFGLFSVRERLQLFGGKLEVQSTPGQGSRVFISVPITQQTTVPPAAADIVLSPQASGSGHSLKPVPGTRIRVLVADDHTVVRQGIGKLLSNELDIEIVGLAADGQEAVDLASKLLPDAILMDMSMPKINGVEATRIIHNKHPDICIIGLSMFEEAERAQAMRDAGAVHYLAKSGPAAELINAIRTTVHGHNSRLSAKIPG
jgi:PAS domain S-box-containing protein